MAKKDEIQYYIRYELVDKPDDILIAGNRDMRYSYTKDPVDIQGRAKTTFDEILAGGRTSTIRSESRGGASWIAGAIYRIVAEDGRTAYVRVWRNTEFDPRKLTLKQWKRIARTERWSVDYLVREYGSPSVQAELKSGTTPRGEVIYVDNLSMVPQGEIAVWGANMQNYDEATGEFLGYNNPKSGQAYSAFKRKGWIGLPTKREPYKPLNNAALQDPKFSKLMDDQLKKIEAALAAGKDIYFPKKGVGTGKANLAKEAPEVLNRLEERLLELGIKNVFEPDRSPIEGEATEIGTTKTNVDAVVGTGKIIRIGQGAGKIDGGTGWAVDGALMRGIPVYIFDDIDKRWYTASEQQRSANGWKAVDGPPTDIRSIAGVGSRETSPDGLNAIRAYVQQLDPSVEIHSGGAEGADAVFEETHAARGGKVISHSFQGHKRDSKFSDGVLVHSPEELASVDAEVKAIARALGRPLPPPDKPYKMNLFRRNMYQFAPGRNIGQPQRPSGVDLLRQSRAELKEESKRKRGFPAENVWDIPNNVYSGNSQSQFYAALTNRTNDLPRTGKGGSTSSFEKKNIKNRYPVVFQGKVYPSAEHAYLALSPEGGKGDTVAPEEIETMSRIIAEKLRQHPRLLERVQQRIAEAGDGATPQTWVDGLMHWTQAAGRWEGNGLESPFLQALAKGAELAIADSESPEDANLIRWIQDPKNQVNLPLDGEVNLPPNLFGETTVMPATGKDNTSVTGGDDTKSPRDFTAELMAEFQKMREIAMRSSTLGSKMSWDKFDVLSPLQKANLYRTLGASGPLGFRFDSLNQEPIKGIDPRRTLRGRINALAATLGVKLPDELNFKPGKQIIADKKTVAQVMADAFMAIRFLNTVETDAGIRISGENRAEIAALMLEMSRIMHEISDPYSLAMIKGVTRASQSTDYLGLTSQAKEIRALGVDMSPADRSPSLDGRATGARLRQLFAAQVGMVPESSPRASEARMFRALDLELLDIPTAKSQKTSAVARIGDSSGIPSITEDNAIYDLQRVVDEFGIWDPSDGQEDFARIDLDGFVDGGNAEAFRRTRDSSIGDLLGIEEALGVIRQYTSVTKMDDRNDYSLLNYRTGFKYLSRLGKTGVIGAPAEIESGSPKVERIKIEKPSRATQIDALRARIEKIREIINSMDRYAAGVKIGHKFGLDEPGARVPIPELEAARATPGGYTGFSGKKIAFLRRDAVEALKVLNQRLAEALSPEGEGRPVSTDLPDFENTFEAELAPKYGEGGAYETMFGVRASAEVATRILNERGWRGLIVAGEPLNEDGRPNYIKVKLPKAYLERKRRAYGMWKAARDEVAAVHGKAYADAYMTSEEGRTKYGPEPEKFTTDYIELQPGEYLLPDPVAREVASLNYGVITDVEINELGRAELDDVGVVDYGVDLADSKSTFKLNIRPIVKSKYLVLKNGTIVANRSSEEGFIQHRKVYPFRVERTGDGGYRIVRLEGYQYEHTDPNQRYGQKQMAETIEKLEKNFSAAFSDDSEERLKGFNSNEMANLLNELQTAVAYDGYSALEILALNDDIFPSLEAEIIASITEHTGTFRTNLAPNWTRVRAQAMIFDPSMTGAERALTTVSPNPQEAKFGEAAKIGKMQSSVEPGGVFAGAPSYTVTEPPVPPSIATEAQTRLAERRAEIEAELDSARQIGDIDAIVDARGRLEELGKEQSLYSEKLKISTAQNEMVHSGKIIGQTLTRDQALMLTSPSTTSIQRAIGGSYTVHDILASPEKFGHSVRTDTMDGDDGAMYIIRALVYMLRLSEEAVVQIGYGNRFSKADMEKFFLTDPAIILADKASSVEAARIGGDTFNSLVRESLDAARLAAMALTEGAKGVLRRSWSDSLDPKYRRHEFTITPAPASQLEEAMYPFYRMLEPSTVQVQTAEDVAKVLQLIRDNVGVGSMRASGALGDKATNFYKRFFSPAGLPDPKELSGMSIIDADTKWFQNAVESLAREASKELGVELVVPNVSGEMTKEQLESGLARFLYEKIKAANPQPILDWEAGSGGMYGVEGNIEVTNPDGTVEIFTEEEYRARAKERKRQKAIDGFDAVSGLDEEGQVIEFDINSDYADEYASEASEEAPVAGSKTGRYGFTGYKFAKAVAVKYASTGDIQDAIRSTLPEFDGLPAFGTVEMQTFFRSFWKYLSKEMSGRMQGPAIEQTIKTLIETQDGRVKLENARRVWIQPTDEGITITSEGGPEIPETMPKIATIQLNDRGMLDVDPKFLIAYLIGTPNENGKYSGGIDKLAYKADNALRRIAWEEIRQYMNGSEAFTVPGDWGTPGPSTIMIRRLADALKSGKLPTFEIEPPIDTPLNIEGYNPDKKKKQSMSGDDMVDPNDYELLQDRASSMSSDENLAGGYIDPEEDVMNLSVKQGKLLGLLQPDQLLPKFSPGLKKIDFGLRTPKGNFGGGVAADVGVMALQGNLTPEGALFSAGLNSVNLFTKSPLKAGLIGSAAGLAATAATGGDLGRTMFGIVGSVLGGGIGAFASGGLGTFVGSTAGSLIADEMWKNLFGSNDGMRPTIRPIQPDIPTVRIP